MGEFEMTFKQKIITLVAAFVCFTSPAMAANFSYTTFDVKLGVLTLDDEFVFFGEAYDDFGVFGIGGSYQFAENIAARLSIVGIGSEGPYTSLSQSSTLLALEFPFPVGAGLDIVPRIGLLSLDYEACIYNICATEDDSGMEYGAYVRAWAVPDRFELTAGYSDTNIDDVDSVINLGAAYWFNRNSSLTANHGSSSDATSFTMGYRYSW